MAYSQKEKLDAWRAQNREHLRKYASQYNRAYYLKHREQINKANRLREPQYLATPRGRALYRHRCRKRDALERHAQGSHTLDQWLQLKRMNAYLCAECGNMEPFITLTEDHILALSKGGTNDITNIQPLCFFCNLSKGAKLPDFAFNFRESLHIAGS